MVLCGCLLAALVPLAVLLSVQIQRCTVVLLTDTKLIIDVVVVDALTDLNLSVLLLVASYLTAVVMAIVPHFCAADQVGHYKRRSWWYTLQGTPRMMQSAVEATSLCMLKVTAFCVHSKFFEVCSTLLLVPAS